MLKFKCAMAGNNIYVQGSYIDIHDNEVVNLSVDKGEVHLDGNQQPEREVAIPEVLEEELCRFTHPELSTEQEREVHEEVKRLVRSHGIQEICCHLLQMRSEKKVLLPQSPSSAYAELVRLGMPNGKGFNENTFRKYYRNK